MAEYASVSTFLEVVRRSQLVEQNELDEVRSELNAEGDSDQDADEAANLLVDRGLVTRWQANLLLQGKYRGFRLGSYRLLDLVGKGGMSSVYLAEHDTLGRRCAIKVLPGSYVGEQASSLQRFHREAKAIAALDHPNIVRAFDLNSEVQGQREIHYLVMEYIEGRTIQSIVDEDGSLPFVEAAEYLRQTARGLAHAHGRGFIHRDVKPSNLILAPDHQVKILDLGLVSGLVDDELASLSGANQETLLGTADYVSPEQALGSAEPDERSDLYSLGCVAYFMLTGQPPFASGTVAERLLAHQMREPAEVAELRSDVPEDLVDIVKRLMAKNPNERLQTASTVEAELTAWLDASGNVLSGNGARANGSTIGLGSSIAETQTLTKSDESRPAGDVQPAAESAAPGESNRGVVALCAIFLVLVAASVLFFVFGQNGAGESQTEDGTEQQTRRQEPLPPTTDPRDEASRFAEWSRSAEEIRSGAETVLYLSFTQRSEQPSTIPNEATHSQVSEVSIHGDPEWVTGRFPQKAALRFGGPTTDQWLQVSEEASKALDFPGSFTLAMWVRLRPFTTPYQSLMAKGDIGWRLSRHDKESYLHFAINDHRMPPLRSRAVPHWQHVDGQTPVDDGQWHFITAVFDADGDENMMSLYVDGVIDAVPVISEHLSAANDDIVTIGANSWLFSEAQQRELGIPNVRPPRQIEGDIDEVIIMRRALSSQEIKQLYEAGKPPANR